MKLRSLNYYLYEGFIGLIRNRLMSVASIITVSSCVLMLIVTYSIAVNVRYMMDQVKSSIGIICDLSPEISMDKVNELYNQILKTEHVKSVKYVSSAEALKDLKESWGEDARYLEGVEYDNPLPRSFVIEVEDLANHQEIVQKLEELKSSGVESITHGADLLSVLMAVNNIVNLVSIIVLVLLGIIAVLIIMNTIKLTVNSRKTEITIMKYVGATDWFIRWPFIIEGVLIGIIGAVIPVVGCWFGYDSILNNLNESFDIIQSLFKFKSSYDVFPILIPSAFLFGTIIGIIGSVTSMRRYLKV